MANSFSDQMPPRSLLDVATDALRKISASLDAVIAAVGADPTGKNLNALIAVAALCSHLAESTVEKVTGVPAGVDPAATS